MADRWHLLRNLGDALEKFLTRKHKLLRLLKTAISSTPIAATEHPTISESASSSDSVDSVDSVDSSDTADSDCARRRQRRVDQYKQVVELHASGMNICGIAKQTNLCRKTIRSYLDSGGFPERRERPSFAGKLTPFTEHIRRRFGEGCHNTVQLHNEIATQGFTGKRTIVKVFVATLRNQGQSLSSPEQVQEARAETACHPVIETIVLAADKSGVAHCHRYRPRGDEVSDGILPRSRLGCNSRHAVLHNSSGAASKRFIRMAGGSEAKRGGGTPDLCSGAYDRPCRRGSGFISYVEQWASRGTGQPSQVHQAPNVWASQFRPSESAGGAESMIGNSGEEAD